MESVNQAISQMHTTGSEVAQDVLFTARVTRVLQFDHGSLLAVSAKSIAVFFAGLPGHEFCSMDEFENTSIFL